MPTKHPAYSKTIWLNLVAAAIAALTGIADMEMPILDPQLILGIVAILNIILRFLTVQPISTKAQP